MSRFLCDKFSDILPYTPGEQPQDMQYIKLNTNESPYPPSPKVVAAVTASEVEKLRLYPDPTVKALSATIADYYGLKPENVLVGNGSDEILAFAFLAFCHSPAGVTFPEISYGFYPVYGKIFNIPTRPVPLEGDFTIDIQRYYGNDSMVVIANPNAPTGIALTRAEIEKILQANPDQVVLVDEAYVDFGAESAVPLIGKYDNLLVCQTFSKSRSLAGGRLGFALASPALIEDLNKMKFSFNPYNINRLSILAGIAAMEDTAYFERNRKLIMATRAQAQARLQALGCTVLDSKTNFLLVKPPQLSGEQYYLKLKEKGILVRYFAKPRVDAFVRITIGTPEEMAKLYQATAEILEEASKTYA